MLKRIKAWVGAGLFFFRNLQLMLRLPVMEPVYIDGITYRGYKGRDSKKVAKIYAQLNGNNRFDGLRRYLYRLVGKRSLLVATQIFGDSDEGEAIVGMNMYYFNVRDVFENTIHEGFVGVIPEMSGRGIATNLRRVASKNFEGAGLHGISTRISMSNSASFFSAGKLGFKSVEEYYDISICEQRCYLVKRFSDRNNERTD